MAFLLGELLVKMSYITQRQLDDALKVQSLEGGRIGEVLVKAGLISEEGILDALSKQFGIPIIDLDKTEIEEGVINLLPLHTVRRYNVMPVRKKGNTLTIAINDPTKIFDLKEIKLFTGYDINPLLTSESSMAKTIEKHYETTHNVELKRLMDDLGATENVSLEILEEEEAGDVAKLESDAKQPPVVQIVNHMFNKRYPRRALRDGSQDPLPY
jgi:type IV pilus assembly protein PilB